MIRWRKAYKLNIYKKGSEIVLPLLTMLLFSSLLNAGEQAPLSSKVKTSQSGEPVNIEANKAEYMAKEQEESVVFSGNVILVQGSTTLKTDRLRYSTKEEKAVGEGRVVIIDKEANMVLTGGRVEYDRIKKYSLLIENPKLEAKAKEELITATGEKMEAFWLEKRAVISGKVKIVRGDMVATCSTATYYDEVLQAVLTGNPVVKQRNNELRGDRITIFLGKEGYVIAEGNARGVYHLEGKTPRSF